MPLRGVRNLRFLISAHLPHPVRIHAPQTHSSSGFVRPLSTARPQPLFVSLCCPPAAAKVSIISSRSETLGQSVRESMGKPLWQLSFSSSPLPLYTPYTQVCPRQPILRCRSMCSTTRFDHSATSAPLGRHIFQAHRNLNTNSCSVSSNAAPPIPATSAADSDTDERDYSPQPTEPLRAWDKAEDKGRLLAFYSDQYRVTLPSGHRFPMEKYRLTHAALRADPSLRNCLNLQAAPLATAEELGAAHEAAFVERFLGGDVTAPDMRAIGLPWSPSLATYCRASAGGCVAATRAVLQFKLLMSASLAGGTHHAFSHRGEGFCAFNDIAVGARLAMRDYGIQRILVIDLDVHQGNGTAAIFEGDKRVTTFDMHGDKNYPWKTRMSNTYDIAVHDAVEDAGYLQILSTWLPRLFKRHQPQLVYFQAGIDALKEDSIGRLSLTRQGLLERNNMVYSHALAAHVPLVIVMGGGYSRPIDASVDAHADVYRSAAYRLAAHHGGNANVQTI